MTRHIPDLLLERYVLSELPASTTREVEHEIGVSPVVSERVEALLRSDEEIRQQYPSARFLRPVARRRSRRAQVLAGALAAAVVALLAVIPSLPVFDGTRIKGAGTAGPGLSVFRRTPGGSERLADGAIGRAGDLLRVGYASAGRSYGVIVSIDGRGAVTLHLPPAGDHAAALGQAPITLLDTAYELDEAPRFERFYFITGARPFDVTPVVAATRGAPDSLRLPAGLEQVTFTVQKEVRK
jgi:hypothetical protein